MAAPQLTADNEDYAYVYFDTFLDGFEFQPIGDTGYVSEDGEARDLFEFVMKITDKTSPLASWHARQDIDLSTTPPPLPEWHTGDLWTPHPDPEKKAYAWKFVCRRDDLISFSTGMWPLGHRFPPSMPISACTTFRNAHPELCLPCSMNPIAMSLTLELVGVNGHPAPLEQALISSQKVRAAIVTGAMHRQTLALIELAEGQEVSQKLVHEIWEETIEPANKKTQTHIRVSKTHVLLYPAGSFPRTAKGSIIRKATEAKFRKEIEEVYETYGDVWHDAKDRYGSISQTTSITVEVVPDGE